MQTAQQTKSSATQIVHSWTLLKNKQLVGLLIQSNRSISIWIISSNLLRIITIASTKRITVVFHIITMNNNSISWIIAVSLMLSTSHHYLIFRWTKKYKHLNYLRLLLRKKTRIQASKKTKMCIKAHINQLDSSLNSKINIIAITFKTMEIQEILIITIINSHPFWDSNNCQYHNLLRCQLLRALLLSYSDEEMWLWKYYFLIIPERDFFWESSVHDLQNEKDT